jgi:hypothetical protein
MPNVRSITPEDLAKYGDALKGKSVGDVITAGESYELEKASAEKNNQPAPKILNSETGITGQPSSVETPAAGDDESEAGESRATRRGRPSTR